MTRMLKKLVVIWSLQKYQFYLESSQRCSRPLRITSTRSAESASDRMRYELYLLCFFCKESVVTVWYDQWHVFYRQVFCLSRFRFLCLGCIGCLRLFDQYSPWISGSNLCNGALKFGALEVLVCAKFWCGQWSFVAVLWMMIKKKEMQPDDGWSQVHPYP